MAEVIHLLQLTLRTSLQKGKTHENLTTDDVYDLEAERYIAILVWLFHFPAFTIQEVVHLLG